MPDLERFERGLGHRFRRPRLLLAALTHCSAGARNNERLEFLGDSVLGMVTAESLFTRFERAGEGALSRTRSTLVNEATLARVARSLGLGAHLVLGGGELKSGGFDRDSILADALEAVIGAVYLDGGLDAARTFVYRHFAAELETADPDNVVKDPKTRLQEHLQELSLELPEYSVVDVSGASHRRHFRVRCRIPSTGETYLGEGSSKRRAEQDAAHRALDTMDAMIDEHRTGR